MSLPLTIRGGIVGGWLRDTTPLSKREARVVGGFVTHPFVKKGGIKPGFVTFFRGKNVTSDLRKDSTERQPRARGR